MTKRYYLAFVEELNYFKIKDVKEFDIYASLSILY